MAIEQATRAFRFHVCVRCGGDAYLDRSEDPADWRCLQCGRVIESGGVRGAIAASALRVE